MKEDINLNNLEEFLPQSLPPESRAKVKTLFYKSLALKMHRFYGGKIAVMPKAGIFDINWFNVWYTPGVSAVSTAIRDNNDISFDLSNRANAVAVVSDSTRVLGDGDCTPAGGLGVMEGKAMLMKYLGGIDATALCINSRGADGKPSADKIIDFVKMCAPTFGAINLEDISQPNCYKALDVLRAACDIPVWHDDAQGTACVTIAGLINALELAGKNIKNIKIILYGSGAANTTIAKFLILMGADAGKIIMFDSKSSLRKNREDLKNRPDAYKQWELCQITNKENLQTQEEAFKNADVLIALSKPGPDTIKPQWIKMMAAKSIVFVCANPVPEIYPESAKQAGAYIVATGRGDFPNQVNNALCFPGILKGVLLCRAKTITDSMALIAAKAIAKRARDIGINENNILPLMTDVEVYALQAAEVAQAAQKEGVARIKISYEEAYNKAKEDIFKAQNLTAELMQNGFIKTPPASLIKETLEEALKNL
ncbi:MAG: NADP-dependent malic enzyme [Elusimicrobiota bacterium]|jgi:malate dehydrogenase (oxaloacetate-decarboxylating)|nr:NADP-dependent malic enzyme [Elusimicrobiota bacterium]